MTTQTNARRTRRNRLVPTALPRACRRSRLSSWGICSSSKSSDSVEAQAQCPGGEQAFWQRGHWASIRWMRRSAMIFFDTPDLQLSQHGGSYAGAEFKKPGTQCEAAAGPAERLSPALRKEPGFEIRGCADPGGFVCSGRMKVEVQTPSSLMCLAVADRSPALQQEATVPVPFARAGRSTARRPRHPGPR